MLTENHERQQLNCESALLRCQAVLHTITQLVWPEATIEQLSSTDALTKLVTKVGVLVRLTANDAQAWQVARKHVEANGKLAKLVERLREHVKQLDRELNELSVRARELRADLVIAEASCDELRARMGSGTGYDANGSPC